MRARDAVATQLPLTKVHIRDEWADEILKALTAAGYRILAPGEVDRETAERCARIAEQHPGINYKEGDRLKWRLASKHDIATAIRALTDGGHDA